MCNIFRFAFISFLLTLAGDCLGQESGSANQIDVAVTATNTYKADTFILIFDIYDMEVSQGEQAIIQLQNKSNEILTSIRNQSVKISEAKVSSAFSRVEFHYNNTDHRYESSSYLVVDHQLKLDNFRDYIVAYSVLLKSGISEDDIGEESQLSVESKLKYSTETFEQARTLIIPKANSIAKEKNLTLGDPVYVRIFETAVTPIFIEVSDTAELEALTPKPALDVLKTHQPALSDEIVLSVTLQVTFESFAQ